MFLLPALITAAASIGGGYMASKGNEHKESSGERRKRKLLDELINSLDGNGKYSDLYNNSDELFQRTFVEPAKQRFNNQIAPQIQQQYIASGQQKSSGMDDQLLRAGVDLNSELDKYAYQNNQDALNRKQNTINGILGAGNGAPANPTNSQNWMNAASGFLSSDAFKNSVSGIGGDGQSNQMNSYKPPPPQRRGFEPSYSDYKNWNLGDSRWGQ